MGTPSSGKETKVRFQTKTDLELVRRAAGIRDVPLNRYLRSVLLEDAERVIAAHKAKNGSTK